MRLTRPGLAQTPVGARARLLGEGSDQVVDVGGAHVERVEGTVRLVFAAFAARTDAEAPLEALEIGEVEPGATPAAWVDVAVRAAALNHHDVWSLRGVGLPADRLPMILGCDAAGVTAEGRQVLVYPVITDPGFTGLDPTLDPKRSLLSERYPGTLATTVRVPAGNLIDKPAELSFAEAACLPTAWLTAYRMLFGASGLTPGQTVLIQGAGGGVATALVILGRHAGLRVWVTSRDPARAERAVEFGAHAGFAQRRAAAGAGRRGDGNRRRGDLVAFHQRPPARAAPW